MDLYYAVFLLITLLIQESDSLGRECWEMKVPRHCLCVSKGIGASIKCRGTEDIPYQIQTEHGIAFLTVRNTKYGVPFVSSGMLDLYLWHKKQAKTISMCLLFPMICDFFLFLFFLFLFFFFFFFFFCTI